VRLFDRTLRAVTLTGEGRRFYAQVTPLLVGLKEAAAESTGAIATAKAQLKVNVDPSFARLVLAMLARISRQISGSLA
jgi:DNA-binding transcriptional LysR family regulator